MMSIAWSRSLGMGIPLVSAAVFFGIIGLSPTTNLFQTGLTVGVLLGVLNLFVAWAIYKNYI